MTEIRQLAKGQSAVDVLAVLRPTDPQGPVGACAPNRQPNDRDIASVTGLIAINIDETLTTLLVTQEEAKDAAD